MIFTTLCLVAVTAVASAQDEIKVLEGSKVRIPCEVQMGFSRCSWKNGRVSLNTDERDSYKPGYRIATDFITDICYLEIDAVQEEDGGQWICTRPMSVPETVKVKLTILSSSSSEAIVKARKGTEARLPCPLKLGSRCSWKKGDVILNTDKPQWYKDGYIIDSSFINGACDLVIKAVTNQDNGQWTCTRPLHDPTDVLVNLTVLGSSTDVGIINATRGSKVIIPCKLENGFSRCSWKNDRGISLSTDVPHLYPSGYTIVRDILTQNCDLEIAAVREGGRWTCVRPLSSDVVTNLNVIDLSDDPTLSITSSGLRTKERNEVNASDLSLTCTFAKDHYAPKAMTWTVNGNIMKPTHEMVTSKVADDTFEAISRLTVNLSSAEESPEAKNVTCTAVHITGLYSLTKIFQKIHPTTFVRLREFPNISQHNGKILSCTANGIPEPQYMIEMLYPDRNRYAGRIRTVTENGIYACMATYQDSRPLKSNEVTVNFDYPSVENITVKEGSTVMLPCKLQNGFSRCTWTKGNMSLSTDVPHLYPSRHTILRNYSTDSCDLEIQEVRQIDAGKWICKRPLHNPENLAIHLFTLAPEESTTPATHGKVTTTEDSSKTSERRPTSTISDNVIDRQEKKEDKLSTGLVTGVLVGAILLVFMIACILWCFPINVLSRHVKHICGHVSSKDLSGAKDRDNTVDIVKVVKLQPNENV